MKRATYLRLQNYAGWHCDSYAQLITSVNDGWVEWLASEDDTGATIVNGLRLVHRESCRYDARTVFRNRRSVVEGLCLERFIGPDGLILLLSLLAEGELPTVEVIELAKRVCKFLGTSWPVILWGKETFHSFFHLLWGTDVTFNRK